MMTLKVRVIEPSTENQQKRRSKRRRPAPSGWTITELCAMSGITWRTVHAYVRRGLLAPPAFRGRGTRYDRDTLLRVTAIRQLKLSGVIDLHSLRRRLDEIIASGLERWVTAQPIPTQVTEALRQTAPATTANQGVAASVHQSQPTHADASRAAQQPSASAHTGLTAISATQLRAPEGWQTIVLLPGLQLCIAENGGPAIQIVVNSLCEHVAELAAASIR